MTNIVQAITNCQIYNNHILYSLLFFLHFTDPDLGYIDVDTPINQFDEDLFVVATTFVELHMGIDIPDNLLIDKTKTLREEEGYRAKTNFLPESIYKQQSAAIRRH